MRNAIAVVRNAICGEVGVRGRHAIGEDKEIAIFARIIEIVVIVEVHVDDAHPPGCGPVRDGKSVIIDNLTVDAANCGGLLPCTTDLLLRADLFVGAVAVESGGPGVFIDDEISVRTAIAPGGSRRRAEVIVVRGPIYRALGAENRVGVTVIDRHRFNPVASIALDCFYLGNRAGMRQNPII